ncbi:hypothetical protein IE81DRAFT_225219 [Ceraceosorus guamensis]|uniref:Uncharacterized protein n=1 Tax=Ceraceosorus guamensis TaxID=1522189 RepID=A0A316W791_9BASI|nr:hypothetical protein IE81DRAFT_225219 [Ceraceosorus guamensis]PWN44998.1 hypothetical protein IE81DRAFT_225219 [Ceraceosorus guamensis]
MPPPASSIVKHEEVVLALANIVLPDARQWLSVQSFRDGRSGDAVAFVLDKSAQNAAAPLNRAITPRRYPKASQQHYPGSAFLRCWHCRLSGDSCVVPRDSTRCDYCLDRDLCCNANHQVQYFTHPTRRTAILHALVQFSYDWDARNRGVWPPMVHDPRVPTRLFDHARAPFLNVPELEREVLQNSLTTLWHYTPPLPERASSAAPRAPRSPLEIRRRLATSLQPGP